MYKVIKLLDEETALCEVECAECGGVFTRRVWFEACPERDEESDEEWAQVVGEFLKQRDKTLEKFADDFVCDDCTDAIGRDWQRDLEHYFLSTR